VNQSIIVFGGYSNKLLNDIWIINIDHTNSTSTNNRNSIINKSSNKSWNKIEMNESPCPRMYHAMAMCTEGTSKGMIVIYGGQSEKENGLDDLWGLRKHRNGTWDWVII